MDASPEDVSLVDDMVAGTVADVVAGTAVDTIEDMVAGTVEGTVEDTVVDTVADIDADIEDADTEVEDMLLIERYAGTIQHVSGLVKDRECVGASVIMASRKL